MYIVISSLGYDESSLQYFNSFIRPDIISAIRC